MKIIISGLVAISLAGCVPQQPAQVRAPAAPYALTSGDKTAISESVRKRLKDPESARFGTFAAAQREGASIRVCGFVNAKNSYGGYTGEEIFLGVLTNGGTKNTTFLTTDISSESDKYGIARKLCAEDGITLSG